MPNKPLTYEQIWGVPEEELPEPEQRDYFDFLDSQKRVTDDENKKEKGGEEGLACD